MFFTHLGGYMKTSLITVLEQIPDKRRAEGKRHPLSLILILTLMTIMSQGYTLRSIEAFVKRHRDDLINCLCISKNRLPSLATIRRALMIVDFNELAEALKRWILENDLLEEDEWISIDGKSIKSTLTNYHSPHQNFVSIVTAFTHSKRIALLSRSFENKKTSEISVVANLIECLGLTGVTFTLDALHGKKNS